MAQRPASLDHVFRALLLRALGAEERLAHLLLRAAVLREQRHQQVQKLDQAVDVADKDPVRDRDQVADRDELEARLGVRSRFIDLDIDIGIRPPDLLRLSVALLSQKGSPLQPVRVRLIVGHKLAVLKSVGVKRLSSHALSFRSSLPPFSTPRVIQLSVAGESIRGNKGMKSPYGDYRPHPRPLSLGRRGEKGVREGGLGAFVAAADDLGLSKGAVFLTQHYPVRLSKVISRPKGKRPQ